jgi:Fe-Mn family superoxide dismutase
MSYLTRREALQSAAAGLATLALAPLAGAAQKTGKKGGPYTLPKLPYDYDALKVSIDEETMRIHHNRHHLAYVTGANNILKKHPKLAALSVNDLLARIKTETIDEADRRGLINTAGGHSNHSIFWTIMGPHGGGEPTGALGKAITKHFGSFAKFQKLLSDKALTQFGSGWAWLVVNKKGELEVVQRPNQDSPIMDGLKPIMGIDVWEHAYYLRYKNARADYITAWWKVVDWKSCNDRYGAATKG